MQQVIKVAIILYILKETIKYKELEKCHAICVLFDFLNLGTQTSNHMILTGFALKHQLMERTTLMQATLLEQMPVHIRIENRDSWTCR